MGAANTKTEQKKNQLLEDWETIDHLRDFNIVRHKTNGTIAEVRKFKLNPSFDPQREISIYKMRQQTSMPIVQSHGSQLLQKVSRKKSKNENADGICASNNHLGVITERIPFTLKNLPQLSFFESLYVLRQSLAGYEFLFPKTGPVHVNQNKVGINNSGKVKVWINEDWAQNHPSDEITSLSSTRNQRLDRQYNHISPQFRDQKEMVENVIDVIEDKCQFGHFPNDFSTLLRQNADSFSRAKKFVNGFIVDRNFSIPQQIHEKTIKLTKKGREEFYLHEKQLEGHRRFQQKNQLFAYKREKNQLPQTSMRQQTSTPIVHYDVETKRYATKLNNSSNNYPLNPPQTHNLSYQINAPQKDGLKYEYKPSNEGGKTFKFEYQKPKVNFGSNNY